MPVPSNSAFVPEANKAVQLALECSLSVVTVEAAVPRSVGVVDEFEGEAGVIDTNWGAAGAVELCS
jgi:hypothetical protein